MKGIPIKARVECTDGPAGKSTHIIADPNSGKLTHIVVKNDKLSGYPDRLVLADRIIDSADDIIHLNCSWDELGDMLPFTTVHYVQTEIPDYADSYVAGEPMPSLPEDTWVDAEDEEHIPTGELALASGMTVQTSEEKKVGHVDGLVVDRNNGAITHVLMQKGHMWGKKDVALPIAAIDSVDVDTVYLKLDNAAVKALPIAPVK